MQSNLAWGFSPLTNNIDAPGAPAPATNTTGTNGDDTFLGATGTFATGDVIDGKGGNDTLKYTSTAAGVVLANVSNVETYSVTSVAGVAELNLLNSSGYKLLESFGGSAGVKFSTVGTLADAHVANTTTGSSFEIAYAAGTVAGTADVQKVALDNANLDGGLTVNGIETLAFTSTGKDTVTGVADTSLKSVTSAGAGALTMSGFTGVVTSFDASTATGAQKIDFSTTASDVAVKGGSAADVFTFGAFFTSKDTVDGGAGIDTVALDGTDFRLATVEGTKGLNALTNVEQIDFTGAGAAKIDQATLTNAGITKFIFDTAGNDTVDGATATTIFATGIVNTGNETFVLKAGNTTLNLALEGTPQNTATGVPFAGADIATLDTGAALTVKLSSTGVNTLKVPNTDFNDITAVANAAGATFTVTGDANTTIGSFTNAVNVDASALTGRFFVAGSGGNDFIKGGTNVNDITGGAFVDAIDISASSTKIDTIHLNGILAFADRDGVAGFTTGTGGDVISVNAAAASTFAPTAAGTPIAIQALGTQAGAQTFLVATNDLLAFNFNLTGNTIGAAIATSDAATSQALLDAVGTITVTNATGTGYILAYQSGNAYLFHEDGAAANLAAANIHLVGTLAGVAVGSVTAANFLLA